MNYRSLLDMTAAGRLWASHSLSVQSRVAVGKIGDRSIRYVHHLDWYLCMCVFSLFVFPCVYVVWIKIK